VSDPVFCGRVVSVVHQTEDFRIAKVKLDGESRTVTVKGYFPSQNVGVGSWVSFAGRWTNHPHYGRQLSVTRSPVAVTEWNDDRVLSALSANGVGPQVRLQLQIFAQGRGLDLSEALDSGDLSGSGWDEITSAFVLSRWRSLRVHLDGARFLSEAGVPPRVVGKVQSVLGDALEERITQDPWILVRVAGISFKEADEVAMRLGSSLDNPSRINGAVLTAVQQVEREGHVYALTGQVVHAVQKMIPGNITSAQVAESIRDLLSQGQLKVERHPDDGSVILYLPWNHQMEMESASMLRQRVSEASSGIDPDTAAAELDKWAEARKVTLTETQRLAAFRALTEPVSILTGLPGTGKTTTLQSAVSVLKDSETPFLLVAPTGIAAKRLASVTGSPASTVHRAFSAKIGGDLEDKDDGSTYIGIVRSERSAGDMGSDTKAQTWEYGPDNPYPADVVIVDESSMVDLHMLYRLLQGTKPTCRLVFVGDPYQLPSVGSGDILRDLASCGLFVHTHLSEIFRQENTSGIVLAAHDIHAGRVPNMGLADFTLVPADDDYDAADRIVKIAKRLYARRMNFQVLSPRHAGDAGVTNLNEVLRIAINPPSPGVAERNLSGAVVREGDRIMVVKNDYNRGVFNGDVGKVGRINHRRKQLVIRIFSEPGQPQQEVEYDLSKGSPHIRLAYAQTIHKCVHPDTLVETPQGIFPIKEIPQSGEILTPEGFKPYVNKVVNPVSDAIVMTTEGGYSLTTTPDHGMDVWDGTRYQRKVMSRVGVGDWVRIKVGGPEVDRPLCELPPLPDGDIRSNRYQTPSLLSDVVAEFLGLMVADGTVFRGGFRLAKRHSDVVARFSQLASLLFGCPVKQIVVGSTPAAEVSSTLLAEWLLSLGGMSPNDKYLPPLILSSPDRVQRAFLRGLFEDGTVNVREGRMDHVSWSTSSERCHREVKTLLLRMGMVTHTTQRGSVFQVSLRQDSALSFKERVGFVSAWKNERLSLDPVTPKGGVVPISKQEASSLRVGFKDILGVSRCQNAMNRGVLSRISAKSVVDSGRDHPLVPVLSDRLSYHHERVRSLDEGSCASVCVEVPDGHRFLQNGISGWNSQGQEYDVIVVPMLSSFGRQLQRNLLYTAITRAKQRVILVGSGDAVRRAVQNNKANKRNTLLAHRMGESSTGLGG